MTATIASWNWPASAASSDTAAQNVSKSIVSALGGKQRSATSRGVRVTSFKASTARARGNRAFLLPAASYARLSLRMVWPTEYHGFVRAPRITSLAQRNAAGMSENAGKPRLSTASCNVARARASSTYSLKVCKSSIKYTRHLPITFKHRNFSYPGTVSC